MPEAAIDLELVAAKRQQAAGFMGGVASAGSVYIGDRLGLYEAMRDQGAMTSHALAARTGLNERFLREWLYHQGVAEILEHRGGETFELTPEAALVYVDVDTPNSLIGMLAQFPSMATRYVEATGAFESGVGIPFGEGQAPEGLPRNPFQIWNRTQLVPLVLPKLNGIVERLEAGGTVADIGCGAGAAPIAIAKAFPNTEVHGFDNWDGALGIAEESRVAEGLTNVSFHNSDERPLPGEPTYDLVITTDCLHDMTRPDLVARALRGAIQPDGSWFIVDLDCAPTFEENLQKPWAAMTYGFSMVACLQSSASSEDGMALGNMGLPEPRLRELVLDAGFATLERLEGIEHPVNAYYVARP